MVTRFAVKGFAPWNVVVGQLSRVIIMIESNDAVTHVTCAWKFHYSTSPLPHNHHRSLEFKNIVTRK